MIFYFYVKKLELKELKRKDENFVVNNNNAHFFVTLPNGSKITFINR